MNSIHQSLAKAGLVRSSDQRIIGGVCGGLARKYGLDPWAVRVLLLLTLVLLPGSQILVYPIAWVLMPAEQAAVNPAAAHTVATPGDGPQDRVA